MRIVVKIGGAQIEEAAARESFGRALTGALAAGHELFVVHGGGNQIRELSARMGLAERQVEGLRVTDAQTAPLVLMVLAGLVNRRLVASLASVGVPAVGLCGADGAIFDARKLRPGGADIGFVGEILHVRTQLLEALAFSGWVPVIATVAPLAAGESDDSSEFYNINADQAAAPLSRALEADALLFLTDVPGVLGDEGELLSDLTPERCRELRERGVVRGGMLPKVAAALEGARALPLGIVKIAPGQGDDAVLAALSPSAGTRFLDRELEHHG